MTELRFAVRVRPGASRTKVGGTYGDDRQLVVAVTARPVDGAATAAVVDAVAGALGIRPARLRVVSGETARTKILSVETDGDEDTIRAGLAALLG